MKNAEWGVRNRRGGESDGFHPQRAALPAADAEGEECALRLAASEFFESCQYEARAGDANRMAERDGSTVDV